MKGDGYPNKKSEDNITSITVPFVTDRKNLKIKPTLPCQSAMKSGGSHF